MMRATTAIAVLHDDDHSSTKCVPTSSDLNNEETDCSELKDKFCY